jgi:hypothetical protein
MVFSMVAGSETEKEDWIRAIGRAIVISRTKSWQEEVIFASFCSLRG